MFNYNTSPLYIKTNIAFAIMDMSEVKCIIVYLVKDVRDPEIFYQELESP